MYHVLWPIPLANSGPNRPKCCKLEAKSDPPTVSLYLAATYGPEPTQFWSTGATIQLSVPTFNQNWADMSSSLRFVYSLKCQHALNEVLV